LAPERFQAAATALRSHSSFLSRRRRGCFSGLRTLVTNLLLRPEPVLLRRPNRRASLLPEAIGSEGDLFMAVVRGVDHVRRRVVWIHGLLPPCCIYFYLIEFRPSDAWARLRPARAWPAPMEERAETGIHRSGDSFAHSPSEPGFGPDTTIDTLNPSGPTRTRGRLPRRWRQLSP
jgi:hypothetical protein